MPRQTTVYEDRPGFHRHKCPDCNCVWEHGGAAVWDDAAHLCPKCGEEQLLYYRGSIAPTFTAPVGRKARQAARPDRATAK